MKTTLILLTSGFPFFAFEGFLNDEIFVASEYYDRILIFAVNDRFDKPLSLPSNVTAFEIKVGTGVWGKRIKALKYIFSRHESWNLLKENKKANFKIKSYYAYIRGLAEHTYSKVYNSVRNIDFESDEQITIYSYWFNDLAFTAVKLKETVFENHKVKIVSRAHRGDLYDERNRFGVYPLKIYNIKHMDKIYPCSANGTRYLQDKFSQSSGKIECRYLGSHDFGIQQVEKSDIFTIVSCSFCVPVKRIYLIIDALALCNNRNKIRWVHLGGGDLLNSLKKYASEKLNGKISFDFYGQVRNDEVIDFYKNNYVDLFINTSSSEGIPFSIMEAMSFGIPVIATDVGGVGELVNDDVGYLLNKDFDVAELADKIEYFANMPKEHMSEFRNSARRQWDKKFNSVKNYNEFYQKLQSL